MYDTTKPEVWRTFFLDGEATQYEASSRGRIRNKNTGHMLIGVPLQGKGYLRVLIYRNGKRVDKTVHRVVWEAFNGPLQEGMSIDHIDEDKTNNSIENLRIMTPSENVKSYLKNHPDHGYQKTIDDKYIRKYFELLKKGVYYKKAWLEAVPIRKATDYSKRLLYGTRRIDLWKEYQPFPLSSYFDVKIEDPKDIDFIIGAIMNGMDSEEILRMIHKDYMPETVSLIYFLRSKYDENIKSKNYNTPGFKKDLDTLLQFGYRITDVIFMLHVDDDKKIRDFIEARKIALGLENNKYRHLSDTDAEEIKKLVELGLTNEEIFRKMNIERSLPVAMFMSSHRKHWKDKLKNSEKTSSTIESITSQDVKK